MDDDVAAATFVVVGVLLTRVRSERGTVDFKVDVDICKAVLETAELETAERLVIVVEAELRAEEASGSLSVVVDEVASIGVR